jgi:hypothetical protein
VDIFAQVHEAHGKAPGGYALAACAHDEDALVGGYQIHEAAEHLDILGFENLAVFFQDGFVK